MRILFDMCVFDLRNKGNISMLQTAVNRVKELWPDADLEVLTPGPLLLKYYVPAATPFNPYQQSNPLKSKILQTAFQYTPSLFWRLLFELRDSIMHLKSNLKRNEASITSNPETVHDTLPQSAELQSNTRSVSSVSHVKPKVDLLLQEVDLFVATGGNYMSDASKESVFQTLDRIERAIQYGIPTVLVGQGIGPIEDKDLLDRARNILPKVDLILIREKLFAPVFLNSIGVLSDRVFFTGDDAIEMVYEARSQSYGTDIGIGLRVASSSEIDASDLEKIKPVLQKTAINYRANFIPLPISHSAYETETDYQAIRKLVAGHLDGFQCERPYNMPLDLIKLTGKSRIVVTGAFHPAVFALAQGIPAVCLAKSSHYANKLSGLADAFGKGCNVLMLDDIEIQAKLESAIDYTWHHAEELRPQILHAARMQIEQGHAGYQRICELVRSKKSHNGHVQVIE